MCCARTPQRLANGWPTRITRGQCPHEGGETGPPWPCVSPTPAAPSTACLWGGDENLAGRRRDHAVSVAREDDWRWGKKRQSPGRLTGGPPVGQPHPRAIPRPRRGGSRCSKAPPVGHNPFRPRHVFDARVLPGTRCQELVGGGGRRRHLPCVPTPASESQRVWSQAPFHSWRPGRHGRDRGSARQWASHDGRDRDGLTWTRVVLLARWQWSG